MTRLARRFLRPLRIGDREQVRGDATFILHRPRLQHRIFPCHGASGCIKVSSLSRTSLKPAAEVLSVSRQFSREQVGFAGKIVGTLHVAVIRRPLGLLHVALDLFYRVLLAGAELTSRDLLQICVAGRQ